MPTSSTDKLPSPQIDIAKLSEADLRYVEPFLQSDGPPELETIWALMDEAWDECGCDPRVMDERITTFYGHPVWLLNGLFVEQHQPSLENRRAFAGYVAGLDPSRVADFGGGYGTLARMIGELCPDAEVHIAEPSPHPAAVALAEQTPNVRYVPELVGLYDVLVATDVFEHVPDPLSLVEATAAHLRPGGVYVMANNFFPVIKCHLPSTFHFRWSWDTAMNAMNLRPGEKVTYGRAYTRMGPVSADSARSVESRSRRWFGLIERTPARRRPRAAAVLIGGRT
jgi:SAM-dependent methyltransferase